MNQFPLIGVSGSVDERERENVMMRCYARAVLSGGAMPVLLSPDMDDDMLDSCLAKLDGVLLAGGTDVDPALYGETPVYELGEVTPLRDQFEMRLVKKAYALGMPVLGICRGIQCLNVAMGGTLWQDLPSQFRTEKGERPLAHSQKRPDYYQSHSVYVKEGTKMHSIVKADSLRVNSFHHQAVKDVAEGMIVSAVSTDGVIEAIEHPDLPFFVGIQWHPERYFDRTEDAKAVFAAFAQAAREYRA